MNIKEKNKLVTLSKRIRMHALRMVHGAKASHIGSCLSMADLLAVLYGRVLKVNPRRPDWPARDRFILSKGHGGAILYAVLAERGFFPIEWLYTYCQDNSCLGGHVMHHVPGVETSTGSLGHGLPIGCGMALAGKHDGLPYRTYVLLSDGELDEGSNWESILFAPQHRLDSLVAIVDYNKLQGFGHVKNVLDLDPLLEKFRAFKWAVKEINGHNYEQIEEAFQSVPFETGRPSVIIAHTVKGKGVSFMENQLVWHYKSPNAEQLSQALIELEAVP